MFPALSKAKFFSSIPHADDNKRFKVLTVFLLSVFCLLTLPTPAVAAVIQVFEAEQGVIKNGTVNPKGYVELNTSGSQLGSIEWLFVAPRAGDYEIRFRYLIKKQEFSPLMAIKIPAYTIAKKRFLDTKGTWQEEAWLFKADQNEQVTVRLGVDKPTLDKSKVERIYVDKLTIDQPSFLTTNVKVVPDQDPEFGKPGYEQTYYGKVDPQGQRTTLIKWLRVNGFTKNSNKSKIVRSQYINSYDLGFGRSMSCLDVDHLACYVDNYINFDREKPVSSKTKLTAFTATVTMERMQYLDPVTQQSRLITAFFVYDQGGNRRNRAPLDNEGAKAVPESCYACHKGNTDSNGNPVGGQFLPFDLNLLEEQRLRGSPSIAAQHDKIREFNHMVWKDASVQYDPSDPSKLRKNSLKNLIEGWYGGEPLPGTEFNRKFIPSTWYSDPAFVNAACSGVPTTKACKERSSYQDVYAKYCRTCHVTHGDGQDVGKAGQPFRNAEEFRPLAHRAICTNPNAALQMPNAELTFHRFSTDIVEGTGKTAKDILCNDVKVNKSPTANPDVDPDTLVVGKTSQTDGNVKINDISGDGTDAENTVTLVSANTTNFGSLDVKPDGSYTYTLKNDVKVENSAVSDIFTYKLTDVEGDSSTAKLTFSISGAFAAINDQRDVTASPLQCSEGITPITSCNVMANDQRGDGNNIKVEEVSPPTNPLGTLLLAMDGTYNYTVQDSHYFDADIANTIALSTAPDDCVAIDLHKYTLSKTGNSQTPTPTDADLKFIIKPNFNSKAQNIFDSKCKSCHNGSTDANGDGTIESNITTFPNNKDTVNTYVDTGFMPYLAPDLSAYQKKIIDCWSKL